MFKLCIGNLTISVKFYILKKFTRLLITEKKDLLQPFLKELEKNQPLQTELKEWLVNNFSILNIQKDEIILSEGETCKYAWVVLNGIIRSFHYVGEAEVTSRLMTPYHIIISPESFYTQTPAFESLQALQPSVLARLHYQQLDLLYQLFPSFNYVGRRLTEYYLFITERRLHLLRKQKATDKYKFFLEKYPDLINEVPLKYIASFLGINQETLSRVRRKIK